MRNGKTKTKGKREYRAHTNHYANHYPVDTFNAYDMRDIDKIKTRIEGLQALLQMSIRLNEPQYTRSIRKDIEVCERELRIQRVQQARLNENWD